MPRRQPRKPPKAHTKASYISRRQKPKGYAGWIALAENRIISVLQKRIAANIRQLETKISESGPAHLRPEPHLLTDAITNLRDKDRIKVIKRKGEARKQETGFYALTENCPQPAEDRVDELLVPYQIHDTLAHMEKHCSGVLESIVRKSFDAAGYTFLGKGDASAPLDGVYGLGSEKIGSEVKNVREWVYPTSGEIWVMVRKCLQINAIPLLITRKTSFRAREHLTALGIPYFEVFRQVFSRHVTHYLVDIQHVDKLGYKDVVAVEAAPNAHLVAYLQKTLPANLVSHRTTWNKMHGVLDEFANQHELGNPKMKDSQRTQFRYDLYRAVFPGKDYDPKHG